MLGTTKSDAKSGTKPPTKSGTEPPTKSGTERPLVVSTDGTAAYTYTMAAIICGVVVCMTLI